MKEESFKDLLNKIDIDPFTDKQICDKILNKNIADDISHKNRYLNKIHNQRLLTKIAVIVLIIVSIGTTSALAANYYLDKIKTRAVEYEEISEEDYIKTHYDEDGNPTYTIQEPDITINYRGGKRIYGYDKKVMGYQLGYESNPYLQNMPEDNASIYPGVDAFANVGFPDLTPTYFIENCLLSANGYVYTKTTYDKITLHKIVAEFYQENNPWYHFYFYVHLEDKNDENIEFLADPTIEKYDTTYTTASGLKCTISDYNIENHMYNVEFLFDTEEYSNILYVLQFSPHYPMEKIYEVLETIPLEGE